MAIKIQKTLPLPPSSNRYWRTRVYKNKSGVWLALTYLSAEAKSYKSIVKKICQRIVLKGDLKLSVKIYRARKIGDTSNFLKVLEDALQGIYFEDDKQIVEIHARRYDDKFNPRVEIEIDEVFIETPLFGENNENEN